MIGDWVTYGLQKVNGFNRARFLSKKKKKRELVSAVFSSKGLKSFTAFKSV